MNSPAILPQTIFKQGGALMENKNLTFDNIEEELKWCAVKMSDGNLEAVSQFVQERNKIREQLQEKTSNQNKGGKTL